MTCINVGGDGVDLTLSRLTPEMFLRIMANVDLFDPTVLEWDYIEDALVSSREYSNSNPLMGSYSITTDNDHSQTIDSPKIIRKSRDVGEKGSFYLLSVAQSSEESWHTLEIDGDFDSSHLLIDHELIRILGVEELTFDFLEGIRYNDTYSESRDASEVDPIKCYLIDDKGRSYSLSNEETYVEAWENGCLRSIAIQNLTKLIDSNDKSCSIWHAAKALRGKLYLFDWLSEIENTEPSTEIGILASSAAKDLEEVKLTVGGFEEYLYESRHFLSYIYANMSGDRPDFDKAISCLTNGLEGEFSNQNIRFAAETFKLRAGYYTSSKKPALAINDYKEAISRFESLREDDDSQDDSCNNEIAECKYSLGLLLEKFGGDYLKQLSEAVELNPECIQKIVRVAKLSRDIVDAILSSDVLSRDSLKNAILFMSYGSEE
jgi:hypothetical protein